MSVFWYLGRRANGFKWGGLHWFTLQSTNPADMVNVFIALTLSDILWKNTNENRKCYQCVTWTYAKHSERCLDKALPQEVKVSVTTAVVPWSWLWLEVRNYVCKNSKFWMLIMGKLRPQDQHYMTYDHKVFRAELGHRCPLTIPLVGSVPTKLLPVSPSHPASRLPHSARTHCSKCGRLTSCWSLQP